MTPRPLILISNDDGILSPGLRAAVEAVADLGSVLVAAPSVQQSAMGRSHRGDGHEVLEPCDLSFAKHDVRAYSLRGTPALVVAHALDALCTDRLPDLMISGINYGENLGMNVTISGTIGAAIQAADAGIPALAMSLQTDHSYHHAYGDVDWSVARAVTRRFARRLLAGPLPVDVDVVKVDVPERATETTECRATRLSRQPYFVKRLPNPSPESRVDDAKLGIGVNHDKLEQESDIHAVLCDHVVSVTPISLDMTSRAARTEVEKALGLGGDDNEN